jgi:anti-anti-sigma regulatory factor
VDAARELPLSSIQFDMNGIQTLGMELLSIMLAARRPREGRGSPALNSVELSGVSDKVLEKLDMLKLRSGACPILTVMNGLPQISPSLERSSHDMALHERLLSGVARIIQAQREEISSVRWACSAEPELKGPVAQASYDDCGITVLVKVPSVPEQTDVSAAFIKFIKSASGEASAKGVPLKVDCEELSGRLGADALGALISARNTLASQGLALTIVNPSEALREQMELSRTGSLFGIESRKAA